MRMDTYLLLKRIGNEVVPKPSFEWDDNDFNRSGLNSKAIKFIINELTCNELYKLAHIIVLRNVRLP